jgi:hypothetical protein
MGLSVLISSTATMANNLFSKIYKKIRKQIYKLYGAKKYWQTVDVAVISPPKAGRTWLRTLLGKLFSLHFQTSMEGGFGDMYKENPEMPKLLVTHDTGSLERRKKLKNYSYDKGREAYAHKKVLFMARDPRDAIVSAYYQANSRENKFQGSLSEFIRDPQVGFISYVKFMNSWLEGRNSVRFFMILRYEDLQHSPNYEIERLLKFMEIKNVSKEAIEEAIEYASFDNMQEMESKNTLNNEKLQAADLDNPDSYKVRKGKVGNYKEELSSDDIAFMNNKMEGLYPDFGYNLEI